MTKTLNEVADEIDTYLSFAESLADSVRPLALKHFRTPLDVMSKLDESPVTIVDRAIEAAMRTSIEARFPSHGIVGEEMETKPGDAITWIIDPIDGTKSFITGFPLFGTLIAVLRDDRPLCSLIDIPALGERWTARPGITSFGSRTASSSGCKELAQARFYTTSPDMFTGRDDECFKRVSRAAKLRRFGGDCYMYGLLASGHCDLVLETGLRPYDYMPLMPIVTGAGGCITDWQGQPLTMHSDGRVLASATPALHAQALAKINS